MRGASLVILAAVAGCGTASGELDVTAVDARPEVAGDAAAIDAEVDAEVDAEIDGSAGEAATPDAASLACRSVSAWTTSAPFVDAAHGSHPLPSFARGGFYYVHTQAAGGSDRVLYGARMHDDGTLGAWFVASPDHGGGPHGFTAIVADGEAYHFRNGHIARYAFDGSTGVMLGDVALLEASVDTSFGGNRYVWDSAVYAPFGDGTKRVVHLGGFSFTPYAYAPDVYEAKLPMPSSFEATGKKHPAERPGRAAFLPGASSGFVFTGQGGGAAYWRARVGEDGVIDPWVSLGTLPAGTGNERGDWFVLGRTLFVIRGAAVRAADVRDDGTLAAWLEMPSLPGEQVDVTWGDGHLEGASWGATDAAVFVTGAKVVFGARVVARACGSSS